MSDGQQREGNLEGDHSRVAAGEQQRNAAAAASVGAQAGVMRGAVQVLDPAQLAVDGFSQAAQAQGAAGAAGRDRGSGLIDVNAPFPGLAVVPGAGPD